MAKQSPLPKDFLAKLKAVTAKRAKTVIDHILKHGFITTEQLKNDYGYNHPPRAIRDVKEHGIPLEMYRITGGDGRSISAYRFGDPSQARSAGQSGRRTFPKSFKQALLNRDGSKCGVCLAVYDSKNLQIDHRVPYEVAGDTALELVTDDYMLVCGSCNRAKSWACEHCQNWLTAKDPATCLTCYWGNPLDYVHIALQEIRRMELVWQADEVKDYERLLNLAQQGETPLPEYVKNALRRHVENALSPRTRRK